MKKIILLTILLISLTSISVSAQSQNEKSNDNDIEISTLNLEPIIISKINFENNDIIEQNKVSFITKHKTIKSTSRRSRVKNIVNFMKNLENKEDSSIVLC